MASIDDTCSTNATANKNGGGESWTISFANPKKRRVSKREQLELEKQQQRLGGGGGDQLSAVTSNDDDEPSGAIDPDNMAEVLNSDEIVPRNLETTREDLLQRLHIDIPRLLCVAKQYPRSCGVTSLVSVWNFLYSRIGQGTLPPVSQEEAMTILGFYPPFDAIRWGPFTGNTTLLRWFHSLNRHFGVTGKAYYLWKVRGLGRTPGLTSEKAQELFRDTLRNPQCAVVYHCHNHYMVPVGFQMIPRHQTDCYRARLSDEGEMTVYIGEVSRGKHPAMHTVKWKDIDTDLNTASPQFFNIRHPELGVQTRGSKKKAALKAANEEVRDGGVVAATTVLLDSAPPVAKPTTTVGGGNLHCLLVFRSDVAEEDLAQFENCKDGDDEDIDELADDVDGD